MIGYRVKNITTTFLLLAFNTVFSAEQAAVKQSQLPLQQVGKVAAIGASIFALWKGAIYYVNRDGGERFNPSHQTTRHIWKEAVFEIFIERKNQIRMLLECARNLNASGTRILCTYCQSRHPYTRLLNCNSQLVDALTLAKVNQSEPISEFEYRVLNSLFTYYPDSITCPVTKGQSSIYLLHILTYYKCMHSSATDAEKKRYDDLIGTILRKTDSEPYQDHPVDSALKGYKPLFEAVRASHFPTLSWIANSAKHRPLLTKPFKNGNLPIQEAYKMVGFTQFDTKTAKKQAALHCVICITACLYDNFDNAVHIDNVFTVKSQKAFIEEGKAEYDALQVASRSP
jgi:hypothetical protein